LKTVPKRIATRWTHVLTVALVVAVNLAAQAAGGGARALPPGLGRDTVQRVCGSTCHGAELVTGKGYTRDSWGAVVNSMVSRGAKASDTELTEIVDYLAKNLPPKTGAAGAGGAGFLGGGSDDAHVVDMAAAEKGRAVYIAECITCHGNKARGADGGVPPNQRGSDLVRSLIVLKDRYGSMIGGFLKQGHPMQSGRQSASLPGPQIIELSHFLHAKVNETLRSGPYSKPINVLTGDSKAGGAYFNGEGGCTKCHSVTADLAGVGAKYDAVSLQQKFLFPRTFASSRGVPRTPAKPVTVTVTPAAGPTVSGTLVNLDDFNVALRDSEGEYHSWKRTASLKVEKHDPFAVHAELLDRYTDKNIHDVVAYLETLK
jgi:cytochrome c oxidase cbb3-type subunit 3